MANSITNSDPALANVKIVTLSPTSKTEEGRIAILRVDGIELPLHFNGASTKEAHENAVSFYKENIFNKVFDLTPFKNTQGVNEVMLGLFSKKTAPKTNKTATSEDKRKAFTDTRWYVKEGETAVRVSEDKIQEFVDNGYLPGKNWAVALAKHEGLNVKRKKEDPDYVNPIAGKILIHKGTETLRVVEDELADRIKDGWTKGRIPKAAKQPLEAPAEATDKVSDQTPTKVAEPTETTPAEANDETASVDA